MERLLSWLPRHTEFAAALRSINQRETLRRLSHAPNSYRPSVPVPMIGQPSCRFCCLQLSPNIFSPSLVQGKKPFRVHRTQGLSSQTTDIMASERLTAPLIITAGAIWPPVCVSVVALRFYTRKTQNAMLGSDDWLTIPALVCHRAASREET